MCGFIAQLVEHRTGIAEVTGSNLLKLLKLLKLELYCDEHSLISSTPAIQKYELFHIYYTSTPNMSQHIAYIADILRRHVAIVWPGLKPLLALQAASLNVSYNRLLLLQ